MYRRLVDRRGRTGSEVEVSCTMVLVELLLNGGALQILPRSTVIAPESDRPAFTRVVLRRLAKEVFLLCASDPGGKLRLGPKVCFHPTRTRTYCTILSRMFGHKPSASCSPYCETSLNKSRTYCDCLSTSLYVPNLTCQLRTQICSTG